MTQPETDQLFASRTEADPPTVEPSPVEPSPVELSPVELTPADVQAPLEALLLLAEDPVTEYALAEAVGAPVDVVRTALAELVAFYDETGRGFELRHVGEGWRYYTRAAHADLIAAHVIGGQQSRLSQAALETLAVIAYLQPISRSRVSAVRGVNVDGVIRTLVTRELIGEAGADEITGAAVFATTPYFLERMGLTSLDDLPDLAPHLPEADELEAELSALAAVPPAPTESTHASPTESEHQSEHDTRNEHVEEQS